MYKNLVREGWRVAKIFKKYEYGMPSSIFVEVVRR
jgi:hypothetical protein